jgi:small subunit ribosomal protein S18
MSFGKSDHADGFVERADNPRRKPAFRPRRCPFSGENPATIDYKDIKVLSKFLSERGKIIPSRVTSVCTKKQRELATAIKRARFLALLPYVND